jgi:hypothetical protein
MPENILALSRSDREVYQGHKKFIRENAKTWVEVWKRVLEIREKQWYLLEYATFKDFCEDVLGLTSRMVRYYLAGVREMETMALNGHSGTNVPSEGALRKARYLRASQTRREQAVKEVEATVVETPNPYAGLSRKELVRRIHKCAIDMKFADAENKIGQLKRLTGQILALAGNLHQNLSKPTEIAV